MRALDFAVQLSRSPFDLHVPYANVFKMPMELGLKLVAVLSPNFWNVEWKLFNDVVNEVDRIDLRVFALDLEHANSSRVVDLFVLKTTNLFAAFPF